MASVSPQILAAISGAIQAYIQEEEALLAAQAAAALPPPPAPPANLWALSGRQLTMQMRLLMQRRGLK